MAWAVSFTKKSGVTKRIYKAVDKMQANNLLQHKLTRPDRTRIRHSLRKANAFKLIAGCKKLSQRASAVVAGNAQHRGGKNFAGRRFRNPSIPVINLAKVIFQNLHNFPDVLEAFFLPFL